MKMQNPTNPTLIYMYISREGGGEIILRGKHGMYTVIDQKYLYAYFDFCAFILPDVIHLLKIKYWQNLFWRFLPRSPIVPK